MLWSWNQLLVTLWMSSGHNVLSSMGCSAPGDSGLLWSPSTSRLVFLFSCCLLLFQHYCLFQRNLPSQDVSKQDSFSFVIFVTTCFRLNLLWGPLVHLSGSPEYRQSSPPAPYFNGLFPYRPSSLSNFQHLYKVTGNTRVWMVLVSVSDDTYCSCSSFLILPLLPF